MVVKGQMEEVVVEESQSVEQEFNMDVEHQRDDEDTIVTFSIPQDLREKIYQK